jgi:hypothetical protein
MPSLFGNSFDSGFNYVYVWLSFIGFLGFWWVSIFPVIFTRVSKGEFYWSYISFSNESTGEMLAWKTSTVSFDCPNLRSSDGSPLVFSDSMHVSSVSW